jgi:hypothetical protein
MKNETAKVKANVSHKNSKADMQADEVKQTEQATEKSAEKTQAPIFPQIRLMPVNGSDQPVLSNYTTLDVAPGMVYIDFGFLEPALITAIQEAMSSNGKLPERVNGRMAARVAVGLDVLHGLHRQLGTVIESISNAARQQLNVYSESMRNSPGHGEQFGPVQSNGAFTADSASGTHGGTH